MGVDEPGALPASAERLPLLEAREGIVLAVSANAAGVALFDAREEDGGGDDGPAAGSGNAGGVDAAGFAPVAKTIGSRAVLAERAGF